MRSWRIRSIWRRFSAVLLIVPLAIAAALSTPTSSLADVEPRRVLMLHSFGLRYKPWTEYAELIRTELSRRKSIDFHDHSLLDARIGDPVAKGAFVDYLQARYAGNPPDLIIAIGTPAASFVQQYRHQLFPKAPMLFTVVQKARVNYDNLTDNDTVVASENANPLLFEHILHVLPKTKTIAIVSGTSPAEQFWQGVLRREALPSLAGRVQFKWYNELSFEDILKDASNLPPHTAIYWQLMIVDAAGVTHEGPGSLLRLAATANALIFTHDDAVFGDGVFVGPMQPKAEVARTTAEVAVRILDGEKAGDIKTPPLPLSPPKYDWRLMQRFEISENALPPGSAVFFKPPTAWEAYRWQIVTVCAVLMFQAGLIALLLLEQHRRRSAEMESRQRMVELAHVNRFATAGEMATSIAHEINQPLGAILNNVETAAIMLESQSPDLKEMKEIVGDIRRDNSRATEVIRRLRSFVTKVPFERKNFDLNDQVAESVKFLSPEARSRDVVLRSKLTGTPLPINGDPIQLQQVFSNLILNALDAASDSTGADKAVTVETLRDRKFVEVAVSDTGPGVSPEAAKKILRSILFHQESRDGHGSIHRAHNH
jgi:hypothetical protein